MFTERIIVLYIMIKFFYHDMSSLIKKIFEQNNKYAVLVYLKST